MLGQGRDNTGHPGKVTQAPGGIFLLPVLVSEAVGSRRSSHVRGRCGDK